MITTVTYRGRVIEVEELTFGWLPKWIPRITPRPPVDKMLEMKASRTPILARKRAKILIDQQIKGSGV